MKSITDTRLSEDVWSVGLQQVVTKKEVHGIYDCLLLHKNKSKKKKKV